MKKILLVCIFLGLFGQASAGDFSKVLQDARAALGGATPSLTQVRNARIALVWAKAMTTLSTIEVRHDLSREGKMHGFRAMELYLTELSLYLLERDPGTSKVLYRMARKFGTMKFLEVRRKD